MLIVGTNLGFIAWFALKNKFLVGYLHFTDPVLYKVLASTAIIHIIGGEEPWELSPVFLQKFLFFIRFYTIFSLKSLLF